VNKFNFHLDVGVCGRANGEGADPNTTTIEIISKNEFPWIAFLFFEDTSDDEHSVWCGGSVIDSKWILTAASCLDMYQYALDLFIFLTHNAQII